MVKNKMKNMCLHSVPYYHSGVRNKHVTYHMVNISPGVGVTEAALVDFSVRDHFIFAIETVMSFESCLYLTSVATA